MIDGVILVAVFLIVIIGVFTLMVQVLSGPGGSKGITKPYITKSGTLHTAKKSRENYIV